MKLIVNRAIPAVACAVLLAACTEGNVLSIKNVTQPDVARVFATPAGVESIIGTLYQQLNNGVNTTNVQAQGHVMSLEGYSTVANFGMNVRATIPRNPIVNDRGNQVDAGNLADFSNMQKLSRTATNAIMALDKITAASGTTGSPAEDARDRAFAFFVNGASLGYTALVYDSAAIINETVIKADLAVDPAGLIPPPLSGYKDVMPAALAQLDTALAIANSAVAGGAGGFPLPTSWLNSPTPASVMTQAQFVQFIHSWKARLRAGVARTPAERAAVDWPSVIADAQAGITGDISLSMGGGWRCSYDCSQMYVAIGWHEMTPMILGMADTSGTYATFMGNSLSTRDGSQVLIITPDQRLPQGATRAAQNTDTPYASAPFKAGRYFDNRLSTDDFAGDGWGTSNYDHKRYLSLFKNQLVGPQVQFPFAENTMLMAEGYIRTGQAALAAPLINASRANHGLAPIGVTDNTTPIAGGQGCVPKVPQPPTFNTIACGTMMEAMKWEKRMEIAYSTYMGWYQDSRGWGDLPAGTALQWPVPNEEMDSRIEPFYNLGGLGKPSSAAVGTYGF